MIPARALSLFRDVLRDHSIAKWNASPWHDQARDEFRSRLRQFKIGTPEEREEWVKMLTENTDGKEVPF